MYGVVQSSIITSLKMIFVFWEGKTHFFVMWESGFLHRNFDNIHYICKFSKLIKYAALNNVKLSRKFSQQKKKHQYLAMDLGYHKTKCIIEGRYKIHWKIKNMA